MPRIRTLKPEHRQHRKVGQLDHVSYRLWVGMILEADDAGRLVYDAEALRVLIFGYHPKVSRGLVESSASLLERLGLVSRYVSAGQTYAWFPSWRDHQRLDHPTPSKLPDPKDSVSAREDSVSAREDSRGIGKDLEGKGRERIGRDLTPSADLTVGFERLWAINPKKVGKATAWSAYRKLAPDAILQPLLECALTTQRAWPDRQGRFFPNLATWLNGQRWEDEPAAAGLLTDKTAGNLDAARRFVERMNGGRPA